MMRLILILIIFCCLSFNFVNGKNHEKKKLGDIILQSYMKDVFSNRKLSENKSLSDCHSKDWRCLKECHLEIQSSVCREPRPNEKCFGEPIRYSNSYNSAAGKFPFDLALLRRFPTCWSALGPLLCSSIFRPCVKVSADTNETMKVTKIFVPLFSEEICNQALKQCSFVKELGLWPKLLDCENYADLDTFNFPYALTKEQKGRIFTKNKKCKETHLDNRLEFPSEQCLWPLVKSIIEAKNALLPLIDSCYLPCESPIAEFDWRLTDFRFRNIIISIISGVILFCMSIYFIFFTKMYQQNIAIFCLVQSFICISFYNAFWVITSLKSIRLFALCVDNGRLRGLNNLSLFNLCTIEAIVSAFTLVIANFWFFSFIMFLVLRPKNFCYFNSKLILREKGIRKVLAIFAYLFLPLFILIFIFCFWSKLPIDPLSANCHVKAGSLRNSWIFYALYGIFYIFTLFTAKTYYSCKKVHKIQKIESPQRSYVETAEATTETTSLVYSTTSTTTQEQTINVGEEATNLTTTCLVPVPQREEETRLKYRFAFLNAEYYRQFELGLAYLWAYWLTYWLIEMEDADIDENQISSSDDNRGEDADDEDEGDEDGRIEHKIKSTSKSHENEFKNSSTTLDECHRSESPEITSASQMKHSNEVEKDNKSITSKVSSYQEKLMIEEPQKNESFNNQKNVSKKIKPKIEKTLISKNWLWIIFVTFILCNIFSICIQYYFSNEFEQEGEKDKIMSSIRCTLDSLKQRNGLHDWYNTTIHFDHQTQETNPYIRKEHIFDSVVAPNCSISMVTEYQFFVMFLSNIIFPLLPFWIACFCVMRSRLIFFNRAKDHREIKHEKRFWKLLKSLKLHIRNYFHATPSQTEIGAIEMMVNQNIGVI